MTACLQARELRVDLGQREVLRDITLDIRPGWTALVGPNGAGKSTLLRALAGLQPLAGGRVSLHRPGAPDGSDVPAASGAVDLHALRPAQRARHIAWLAQQGDVTGDLTVRETVELGRIASTGLFGARGPADDEAVERAMALTECGSWQLRRLQDLSGGERQRVLLARVLATEVPILLLDEPTTHLDAPHQVALARLLRRLASTAAPDGRPRTFVTVLHDLTIALQADHLLVLDRGRLRTQGAPTDRTVQAELTAVFEQAIRIEPGSDGRPRAALALDGLGGAGLGRDVLGRD